MQCFHVAGHLAHRVYETWVDALHLLLRLNARQYFQMTHCHIRFTDGDFSTPWPSPKFRPVSWPFLHACYIKLHSLSIVISDLLVAELDPKFSRISGLCHLKTIDWLHIKIYIQTSVSQKRLIKHVLVVWRFLRHTTRLLRHQGYYKVITSRYIKVITSRWRWPITDRFKIERL